MERTPGESHSGEGRHLRLEAQATSTQHDRWQRMTMFGRPSQSLLPRP